MDFAVLAASHYMTSSDPHSLAARVSEAVNKHAKELVR